MEQQKNRRLQTLHPKYTKMYVWWHQILETYNEYENKIEKEIYNHIEPERIHTAK